MEATLMRAGDSNICELEWPSLSLIISPVLSSPLSTTLTSTPSSRLLNWRTLTERYPGFALYYRSFLCMEATCPYVIKNQRKARNALELVLYGIMISTNQSTVLMALDQ